VSLISWRKKRLANLQKHFNKQFICGRISRLLVEKTTPSGKATIFRVVNGRINPPKIPVTFQGTFSNRSLTEIPAWGDETAVCTVSFALNSEKNVEII
jgi:hypothetical protein